MENLWKDIRFSFRTLLRSPVTTAVALVTLALGIGANTAIFSVISGVMLEPLPYEQPEELVRIWESNPSRGYPRFSVSPPNFDDWRKQNRSFERIVMFEPTRYNLTGGERPEVILGTAVSYDFFELFGVKPALGRTFRKEEGEPGKGTVAILSHAFWKRRFGGDPKAVGRTITLDGRIYNVVGIAPETFKVPAKRDVWVPRDAAIDPQERGAHYLGVIARLKDGVGLESARTEMVGLTARLERAYPDSNTGWTSVVIPMREAIVEDVRPALLTLMVAVGFVLLIACANVANLLLARAATREREMAIRTALGANRRRLVRQMLVESLVLFTAGGLLGLGVAKVVTRALVAMNPDVPRADAIDLDPGVLLFTLGLALLTGLVFGFIPALSASTGKVYEALKEGGRAMAGGRSRLARNVLVLGEVAIALVLLVGAGLLIQSFSKLSGVDPGFRPEGVLTADISIPAFKYAEEAQQEVFFGQLQERLRAIPGVEAASTVTPLPLGGGGFLLVFSVEGRPLPKTGEETASNVRITSPDYFKTMGIPLLQGRAFDDRDREGSLRVAVVNRTFADKTFPGESPLGKRMTFGDPTAPDTEWLTIVGVVGDVRHDQLGEESGMEAYWSQLQSPSTETTIVLRTAGDPGQLVGPLRDALREIDADVPLDKVRPMEQVVSEALSQNRFKTLLLGFFAGIALLLAAVGVYGVISYTVAQRTHEIGIRMALGARPREVLRLVVRQGMTLVLLGVVAGLALAGYAVRFLSDQMYGMSAFDPMTFALVPLVLAAVALVANLLPALRATRVDPLEALRYE